MSKLAKRRIKPARDSYSRNAQEVATGLARGARDGEVISITGIAELRGGSIRVFGTSTHSRQRVAGMLLDAAIRRLGYEWDD